MNTVTIPTEVAMRLLDLVVPTPDGADSLDVAAIECLGHALASVRRGLEVVRRS